MPKSPFKTGITVGYLLTLSELGLTNAIAPLKPRIRLQLINLASHGLANATKRVDAYNTLIQQLAAIPAKDAS